MLNKDYIKHLLYLFLSKYGKEMKILLLKISTASEEIWGITDCALRLKFTYCNLIEVKVIPDRLFCESYC